MFLNLFKTDAEINITKYDQIIICENFMFWSSRYKVGHIRKVEVVDCQNKLFIFFFETHELVIFMFIC